MFDVEIIVTWRPVAESMARNLTGVQIVDGPMIDHGRVRTFRLYGMIPNAALYDLLMRDVIEERASVHRFELREIGR